MSQNLGGTGGTRLTGRLATRGTPGWADAMRTFNARIDRASVEPIVIVYVRNAADVATAIRYARENDLPFRIRCGGHSYEGYCLVKDGLVIDVTEINHVNLDTASGRVSVGAGVRCLDLAEKLAAAGRLVPIPTFASVGIAGATLGGGAGVASRRFGLTIDNLVSAQVVLADGRLVAANDRENPDLFWALKGGGGGNFGVVTEFTFQTHPARNVAGFSAEWDWSVFDNLVDFWQRWATEVEDGLTAILDLRADGKIQMFGQYTPAAKDVPGSVAARLELMSAQVPFLRGSSATLRNAEAALRPLFDRVPPRKRDVRLAPLAMANRAFAQVNASDPDWRRQLRKEQIFKSTSAFAMRPFPKEALAILRRAIESSPKRGTEKNADQDMVRLLPGGGLPARVDDASSAVAARQAKILLQYDAYWELPEDTQANVDWVERMRSDLLPYAGGAYINYHDSLIADPLVSYHGTKLRRLVEIKAKYDPENVFNYPQSVPPKLSADQDAALRRADAVG
jgi:FAD/FMN-containing dehydrogenase